MKFEEALSQLREGKHIKLRDRNFYLSYISKIYYDNDINRPADTISSDDLLRYDWEIKE